MSTSIASWKAHASSKSRCARDPRPGNRIPASIARRWLGKARALFVGAFVFFYLPGISVGFELQQPPSPPAWSDLNNSVQGFYATGQEVCDARRVVLNWSKPLIFRLDPAADWKGFCESERWPGWIDVLGYPFKGSQCPYDYRMIDAVDAPNSTVSYGPSQYCQANSWPACPAHSTLIGSSCQCDGG